MGRAKPGPVKRSKATEGPAVLTGQKDPLSGHGDTKCELFVPVF